MKTVLITGGSRGIGSELVRHFAKNGYSVAFTYKSSINEASDLAKETGALAIRADSAVESDVLSAVEKTVESFGGIDCLINNAAISSFSLFTDITLDEWNNMLAVNLTGAFLYSKAVEHLASLRKIFVVLFPFLNRIFKNSGCRKYCLPKLLNRN